MVLFPKVHGWNGELFPLIFGRLSFIGLFECFPYYFLSSSALSSKTRSSSLIPLKFYFFLDFFTLKLLVGFHTLLPLTKELMRVKNMF